MNGLQTQVGAQQAPAIAGDYASGNPRAYLNAGQGALVAGPNGLTIGAFAWLSGTSVDNDNAPAILNNSGSGPVAGFVHRQQQGLITAYLADAGMTIPKGFQVAACTEGDFWVVNNGATSSVVGQKAYANFATGLASFAATASPGTASGTASSIAAGAGASVTGSIAGNVLTVTAGSGLVVGGIISGTGVASGTQILSQLTGTAGGIGTYSVSIPEQTVASTTITETWGVLTVGGTVTGTFSAGDPITGTSVPAGSVIQSQLTGTPGGAGTYLTQLTGTAASTTITANTNVETKWIAQSVGAVGELVKITSWPQG
jgi:hypothetical protein